MDIGTADCQRVGLTGYNAVCATAIEVATDNLIMTTTHNTDDTTVAIAALGMADGQVLYLAVLTVNEVQAVRVAGIHLDTGILLAADDEIAEILQRELLSVVGIFTDNNRNLPTTFGNRHP